MSKEEWGKKRLCPTTGKRFFDLNRVPIVSPYTGEVITLDTNKSRSIVEKAKPKAVVEEDEVVLEDDEDTADVDLGDDVLDDDDDDEDVSLDDIADVAGDDDDH